MRAVGRFLCLFFLEWILDMAICMVVMFSLGVIVTIPIWIFGPNDIDLGRIPYYEELNIHRIILFVIFVNLLRSYNQIIINSLVRSIVSYFYFNIYLNIFIISIPAILVYGYMLLIFFLIFFGTQEFDWSIEGNTQLFWFFITLPFVISTLTAPYIVYRWTGEVFESRINRKVRAQLEEKDRMRELQPPPEKPWWEEGFGPDTLLDLYHKCFRKRSTK